MSTDQGSPAAAAYPAFASRVEVQNADVDSDDMKVRVCGRCEGLHHRATSTGRTLADCNLFLDICETAEIKMPAALSNLDPVVARLLPLVSTRIGVLGGKVVHIPLHISRGM